MKKILSLLVVTILVLAGCSGEPAEKSKIGFVTDTGGINDKSFNQGTYEGIQKYASENDMPDPIYIESKEASQYEANLTKMAQDTEVVVAAGYPFEVPIYNVAKANPDTNFVLIDGEPRESVDGEAVELDNVSSYMFKEQEAGYLVGYIAGKTTKTDHVGFIGGIESPPVQRFGFGYIEGVNDANPDAVVEYQYAGSFDDTAKGKQLADIMYGQGADIVFSCAGGVNAGIIQSAVEKSQKGEEVWVIGVDRDMYEDGKYQDSEGNDQSVILTSAVKEVGVAAAEGVASHFDGNFKSGVQTLGLEEEGVGIPDENPNLEDDIAKEAIEATEKRIEKGALPTKSEEVDVDIKVNGKY